MKKICQLCGKEFETNRPTRKLCDDVHYKICSVCGKEFEITASTLSKKTCSKECMKVQMSRKLSSDEVREKTIATNMQRYGCSTPGESEIIKEKVRQTNRKRYGTDYAIQNEDKMRKRDETNIRKYGSRSCLSNERIREKCANTLYEHYGVLNPGQSDIIRQRVIDTNNEKYGVDNPMQNEEIRNRAYATNVERYGVEHPAQSADVKETFRWTCQKRYGSDSPFESEGVQKKIHKVNQQRYGGHPMSNVDVRERQKQTCIDRYGGYTLQSPELRKRVEETCIERYGTPHPSQSDIVKAKVVETNMNKYGVPYTSQLPEIHRKSAITRSKHVAEDGTHVDSEYELLVYNFCLRNNIPFEYQPTSIEYEHSGIHHSTTIDFKIGGMLFECKGGHLLQGCFEHAHVPIGVKLDVYRKNQVILITDRLGSAKIGKPNSTKSNGVKYQNKCKDPLIGIDVELFKQDPKFPYREDRPHCFYDVKVDGQKSAYEAFYDEKIRWDMIVNRINYSGGFIDNKQVLNALNITRTCKQPSWFTKSFAMEIIQKYCTTDIIVDPFAGWGARCDAAKELHKRYIGADFNKELVEWHHQKGRYNIEYGDANEFKYNENCSVFICPPYSDPETGRCFEDYNFEGFDASAKSLSQCDWLRIVIDNVPNASQYVMVCKIVDEGWDKYIVDTKKNKSHFGTNYEYIVVVPGRCSDV